MTFQNSHDRFYVSLIGSGEGRHTTHLLKCVLLLSTSQTDWKQSSDILSDISFDMLSDISSDILSDISSDILSDISSDILSDISSDILSDISFDILSDVSSGILSGILSSDISSEILSDISFDILSDISSEILSDISFDILSDISSNLLSDISFDILSDISSDSLSDISPHMIAVEGRRGTLNSQDRGWGPARNTELARSRLRSDTEHWRGGGGGGQGGEGEGHSSPSPDRWGKKLTWENAAIWMLRREIGTPLHPRHPIPLVRAFVVHPSNTDRIFHVILHCLRVVVSPKAERSIYNGWWFQLKWRIWVKTQNPSWTAWQKTCWTHHIVESRWMQKYCGVSEDDLTSESCNFSW